MFDLGKTYVSVGFVDNSDLLFGNYRGDSNESIKYYGLDMNPICVARSMLVYEMLKQGKKASSIFEVWYLSSLKECSLQEMKETLETLLLKENLQPEIKQMLTHW